MSRLRRRIIGFEGLVGLFVHRECSLWYAFVLLISGGSLLGIFACSIFNLPFPSPSTVVQALMTVPAGETS